LYLPTGLIASAKLGIVERFYPSAQRDLEEALVTARRSGAKFSEWQTNLALAQLCLQNAMAIDGMESYRHHAAQLSSLKAELSALPAG
jgi:hypothetical protein